MNRLNERFSRALKIKLKIENINYFTLNFCLVLEIYSHVIRQSNQYTVSLSSETEAFSGVLIVKEVGCNYARHQLLVEK